MGEAFSRHFTGLDGSFVTLTRRALNKAISMYFSCPQKGSFQPEEFLSAKLRTAVTSRLNRTLPQ